MVAGIIVCAAADEKVLSDPGQAATAPAAWMTLGGPALFLAGHAAFKFVVWRVVSWPRLAGITALALPARTVPALALAACTAAVVIAVAATGRLPLIPHPEDPEGEESPGPAFS